MKGIVNFLKPIVLNCFSRLKMTKGDNIKKIKRLEIMSNIVLDIKIKKLIHQEVAEETFMVKYHDLEAALENAGLAKAFQVNL